ncbi:MAG: hypothetical protein F4Z31_05210 [Gemmatimonadetes bacterium]|nr:hypothetical protein [Gemmatimonadota bacterium]MYF08832.1 hypothetical protein [Rhodospirillaceae bacterium]MYJ63696.1 hypothetical protein [Acidimicrobiia bacterium]
MHNPGTDRLDDTPPPSHIEHLRTDWPLLALHGLLVAMAAYFAPGAARGGDWAIFAALCLLGSWAVLWLSVYATITARRSSTIRMEKKALRAIQDGTELPEAVVARHEKLMAKDRRRDIRIARRRQYWGHLFRRRRA